MRFALITCLLAASAMKAVARPRGPTPEDIMEALARRQEPAETAADGEEIDIEEPDLGPELEDPNENNNRMIGDLTDFLDG